MLGTTQYTSLAVNGGESSPFYDSQQTTPSRSSTPTSKPKARFGLATIRHKTASLVPETGYCRLPPFPLPPVSAVVHPDDHGPAG